MKNDIDLVWWVETLLLLLLVAVLMTSMACIGVVSGESIEDIEVFLMNDNTDTREWLPYYSCGHFSRDLSYNASIVNITLGSVILGNNPVLRGYNNHIMNYIVIENKTYLIEPQTDEILLLNQTMYSYYRLYPNGRQVPSNWACNLATKRVDLSPPIFYLF